MICVDCAHSGLGRWFPGLWKGVLMTLLEIYLSLDMFLLSCFQMVLKSLQNSYHTINTWLGVISFSPDFGFIPKYPTVVSKLQQVREKVERVRWRVRNCPCQNPSGWGRGPWGSIPWHGSLAHGGWGLSWASESLCAQTDFPRNSAWLGILLGASYL